MAGVSERNRQRIAIALFALSLCLILIGFGIILQNLSAELPGPVATRPANVPPAVKEKAFALKWMLLWLLIFGLILAVSILAFLRWSRSFRRWMFHKPRPPTPSEDVWAMHKLPEGAIEAWDDRPEDERSP